MALGCYHHIGFIQHKYLDLLGVNELELGAPVQDCPGGANDNLLTDLLTSFHCGEEMFAEGVSKEKPALEIKARPVLLGLAEQSNSRLQTAEVLPLSLCFLLL